MGEREAQVCIFYCNLLGCRQVSVYIYIWFVVLPKVCISLAMAIIELSNLRIEVTDEINFKYYNLRARGGVCGFCVFLCLSRAAHWKWF